MATASVECPRHEGCLGRPLNSGHISFHIRVHLPIVGMSAQAYRISLHMYEGRFSQGQPYARTYVPSLVHTFQPHLPSLRRQA